MIGSPARVVFERACIGLFFLVCVCPSHSVPAELAPDPQPAVIAIGDIHGDFDDFCSILKRVNLLGEGNHWAGGKITLIQTGDQLDRGPKEREVLDLLMSLEKEASTAGGRVIVLLGNHEMMNLMGDLRYVTPEIYASFATPDSSEVRKKGYKEYVKWRKENSRILDQADPPIPESSEADWLAKHPPGFVEQRAAFSRTGTYGKWLREHNAVQKFNGITFLHGGIAPELSQVRWEEINSRIHTEINTWDDLIQYLTAENLILPYFTLSEITAVVKAVLTDANKSHAPAAENHRAKLAPFLQIGSWLCIKSDGPLWFRGYDAWSDEDGAKQIEPILAAYDTSAFVVSHTIQKTQRIRSRFNGKVFLIDTGMQPTGKASALEIWDNREFKAVYLDGEEALTEKKAAAAAQ